jgi:2-polyprenyl-3-methyl-5-hydroxy-6-metoxy-1,4-benzoquinol methylase
MKNSKIEHWDNIYNTKEPHQMSWTQAIPRSSLGFIHLLELPKFAKIIDVGGGDSKLIEYLLKEGFENLSVLDISEKAIEKAKKRLGKKADKVNWIVSDITDFNPKTTYDFWHDRATFHFLTAPADISKYLKIAKKAINGYLAISTFAENGPNTCSGLPVKQYSEITLTDQLKNGFEKIKCISEEHITPFETKQNFTFCSFKKI